MNTPRNPEFEISLEDEEAEVRPETATTSPPAPTVTTSPC
jgi:hypothetical protein